MRGKRVMILTIWFRWRRVGRNEDGGDGAGGFGSGGAEGGVSF